MNKKKLQQNLQNFKKVIKMFGFNPKRIVREAFTHLKLSSETEKIDHSSISEEKLKMSGLPIEVRPGRKVKTYKHITFSKKRG